MKQEVTQIVWRKAITAEFSAFDNSFAETENELKIRKIHFSLLPLHAWRLRKSHTTITITKEVTYLAASQKHNWDLLQTAQ